MILFNEAIEPKSQFPYFIFIILGVVIFLIFAAALTVLFVFVFSRLSIKKTIRDLERKFTYLHSFLIGQCATNIRRLDVIARSNLLYVDTHARFLKRFKDLRDKKDVQTQNAITNIKGLLADKKYRQVKEALSDVKSILAAYEKDINALSSDLVAVIKPEEDARQAALTLKEDLRRIKQDFYSKEADLELVHASMDLIFKRVEDLFTTFDGYIECAQYEEANAVLNEISPLLKQTSQALTELPKLCVMVNSLVPEKINHLKISYEDMMADRYPLAHLNVAQTLQIMERDLAIYRSRIKQFNLRDIDSRLNEIINKCDELESKFEEETNARAEFEQFNETIYHDVTIVERRFVKLANNIPEIEKIYVVNDAHKEKLEALHKDVDNLGSLKRALNTYVHSINKQPYSMIVTKLNELKTTTEIVQNDLDSFSKYLISLKDGSQSAYNLIFEIYDQVKSAEKIIRDINIDNITKKYEESINRIYALFDEIKTLLYTKPIPVDEVNVLAEELSGLSTKLLNENGQVMQDYNMMILAKSAIIYANRGRSDFADIAQILEQADLLYNNGEFEQAYILSGDALKKIRAHMSANERL